ncbi:chaski isoform X1 [Rhodnius prolixus]|uniref:chaski isoform X1 n=1 Tax=Rhodnius prolixus TaxID=13249 RepID=UPI003D18B147
MGEDSEHLNCKHVDNFCISVQKEEGVIPDGGWGWVVVFGSLVISMIADGISFSFGLLYEMFLVEFGESKSVTSWIGSLFMAVPLLSGPLCSALVDRFGCRWMTILGGILSCAGFVLSAFATSISQMYITFGAIAGLGLGLCYVTAVVSVAYWFDKKRTLATSLGACGTGVGTFLYAPLTRYLIDEYTWRGAVLILSGTLLNLCVCGALMRDPEWWIEAQRSSRASSVCHDLEEIKRMIESPFIPSTPPPTNPEHNFQSLVNLPTFVDSSDKVSPEVVEELLGSEQAKRLTRNHVQKNVRSVSETGRLNSISEEVPAFGSDGVTMNLARRSKTPHRPTSNHLRNIRVHRNSVMYRGAILNIQKYRLRASSCPNIYRNSMTTIARERPDDDWKDELLELLKGMTDISMFGDLHFLLMSLASILLFIWFIVPYFYIADYMTILGYTVEQSWILSAIGAANTIGMLIMGWMGDRPWVNVTKVYAGCLFATGVFTLLIPFVAKALVPLICVSVGFGMFVSSNFSFTPTILVQLIDLERFTTAYGLTLLCQGIGNLLGPPIAGWLFDVTLAWDIAFYFAGGWIIVAGFLVALIPITKPVTLCGAFSKAGSEILDDHSQVHPDA